MEWKKVKLGEVAYYVQTKSRHKELTQEDYISTENMLPNKRGIIVASSTIPECYTKFQPCDILISNIRPYFQKIWFANRYGGCSNDVLCIRGDEKVIPVYLYYLLSQDIFFDYVMLGSKGTKMPRGDKNQIMQYEFPLPPLETQHRIAAILSSLDDKIENNNRINRNLEAQAQALFKSWFVDFEPFGGKMPEDWKEGTLGEIAHVTSGKRPPLKQSLCSADINIPLIGAADIMGYTNSVLYTTPILVTGRVGTHGIVQRFNEPCWPSDNTLVVEGKWYEYIYQTMCRIDYHNMNRGSTQPLITQTDLKNQKVIIPNVLILDKFETQVTILYKQVYINQRENDRLAALRDTLLPKLMKGEIEV